MSEVSLLGTRVSICPVFGDIEHGIQRGSEILLPNTDVVQTEKAAPNGGSCYALQHPDSSSPEISTALAEKGYSTTPYDLVSGEFDNPVFLGDARYSSEPYWFFIAEDGVLCVASVGVSGGLFYTPLPSFIKTYDGFGQSLVKTAIPPASSVASDMGGYPVRVVLDVKNNGAEAILSAGTEDAQKFSMGHHKAIYHVKLSGPSTNVVMADTSRTIMSTYRQYPQQSYEDYWLHTGETGTKVLHPASTAYTQAVLSGSWVFWRERIASARFKGDGSVEVIKFRSTESGSSSGTFNWTPNNQNEQIGGFTGNASCSVTVDYELLGADNVVIDSFSLSISQSSTSEWILGGDVLYMRDTMTVSHSALGGFLTKTATTSLYKTNVSGYTVGYYGSMEAGDGTGYAYIGIGESGTATTFTTYYYTSVERVSNKIYSLGFNGEFYYSTTENIFLRSVKNVCGVDSAKFGAGIISHNIPPPTKDEYANGQFTNYIVSPLATQHPITGTLYYGGNTDANDPCCYV